ncbi:MAG: TIGR01212 family radical SAM protein, partial [Deltaproteobacteria bacterium]
MTRLFNPLSDYLKERFGGRTFKVTVDAGFTCPNRDGTKGRGGCVYCKPETLIPQYIDDKEDIEAQITRGIEIVRKRHKAEKFIAYFQVHTNTYAEPSRLRDIYGRAVRFP